jgi:restriction system protein
MAIPDYQSLMLPVLKFAAEGEVSIRDCIEQLAAEFKLTDEERTALLPSGKQPTFANRVHWARTYLAQAGLLEATRRGHFKATQRGLDALAKGLGHIDVEYLLQFDEFRAFRARHKAPSQEMSGDAGLERSEAPLERATPEERIDVAHSEITAELRAELLERVVKSSPAFFERLIVDLLIAMNYGGSRAEAGKRIGRSGDGGIDGVINEDPLGLDIVYLQAKRYAPGNNVGIDKVREFAGALVERGATKGVFVTTSDFAPTARTYVDRIPQRLILIDGEELTRLMVRYGVGVRTERTIDLKKLDLDYFEEEPGA